MSNVCFACNVGSSTCPHGSAVTPQGTIALDNPLQKGWRGSFVITVPGRFVEGAYLFADSNFSDGEMFYATSLIL